MKTTYRETRYVCGNYLEVNIYPVYPVARSRGKKRKPSSDVQERLNDLNAKKKLTRLLNTNFDSGDIEIHLTYAPEKHPADYNAAKRDIQNYLRRVRRWRQKNGCEELKYIWVCEGDGMNTRFHFHVTMNAGVPRDTLDELWGFGYANSRKIEFNEHGAEGLAEYITKQLRRESPELAGSRRWNGSRNLKKPKVYQRDGKISARRVKEMATHDFDSPTVFTKQYPGWSFAGCSPFHNPINNGYYLRVRMYRDGYDLPQRRRRRGEVKTE